MQIRRTLLVTAAALAVSLLQSGADSSRALAQAAAALSGQVTSAEEGAMEGVMVTAKKAGSTVAISVASDADGKFSFPAAKIEPGDYTIAHPRHRLRARWSEDRDGRCAGCTGRGQAEEDQKPRGPAHQRRMVHELPRHGAGKGQEGRLHGPLHELPHLRAHREIDLRHRRLHQGAAAHGHLCARAPRHTSRRSARKAAPR